MPSPIIHLMLADDDPDDCLFFEEALKELPFDFSLHIVNDGEQLMNVLISPAALRPDILFLDINMPRKTGYECLAEIKENTQLTDLTVIILTTSLNHDMKDRLYEKGAFRYIRKPGNFSKLKKAITAALTIATLNITPDRTRDNFIIEV